MYTTAMADDKNPQSEPQTIQVMAEPGKLVGKLATKVGLAKGGSNFIISFLSELPGEPAQIIERIVLDENNFNELIKLFETLRGGNDAK